MVLSLDVGDVEGPGPEAPPVFATVQFPHPLYF